MDLVQRKGEEGPSEDMSPEQSVSLEQSVSPDTSGTSDEIRDSEFLPRVGDEYQAQIPSLGMKSDDLDNIYIGLPVPIVWTNGSVHLVSASNLNESPDVSEVQEVKPGDDMANQNLANVTHSGDLKVLKQEIEVKIDENIIAEGQVLIPSSRNDSWSEIEVESLLLGLYIFGKNLIQVKKFVGTKQMGDILWFYYGKFYRSKKYRRWSVCRKAKGKKCVCGQKLFTGWRQQELSSRLVSTLSVENQNTLMEVSRRFAEGKIPLEEYIFSLKATVGLNALVEAMGIGKGKHDLTIITDPNMSNHIHPSRPEIPVGKACSMLTPLEIIKFLTGDFRLSKARSSDLFWEAVWPRLLAKGWHSEQANNYGNNYGLKHSLVFLIPGVKKFCRRKQVKGDHYFDSVSDVLNKVASDPGLLELENEVDKHGSEKEESELTGKMKPEQDGFPSQQRFCYLKPRTPVHNTDAMKFMVVDTSLAMFKIRELRSLPVEIMNMYASRSCSKDEEQVSSDVLMDDSYSDNDMSHDEEVSDVSKATRNCLDRNGYFDEKTFVGNSSNKESDTDGLDSTDISMKTQEDERITNSQEASCNPVNIFISPELRPELSSSSDHDDLSQNILAGVDSSKDNLPLTSFSRSSPVTSSAEVQPRAIIDLNFPIPQEPEKFGSSTVEIKGEQKNIREKCFDSLSTDKKPEGLVISEPYSIKNSRRQSNRNRPLTIRALEAHALGLLDVKPKRKRDIFL